MSELWELQGLVAGSANCCVSTEALLCTRSDGTKKTQPVQPTFKAAGMLEKYTGVAVTQCGQRQHTLCWQGCEDKEYLEGTCV